MLLLVEEFLDGAAVIAVVVSAVYRTGQSMRVRQCERC
jgi:hypothetical protein